MQTRDCFKTLTLREILKIQNPLLEEHYVRFWKSYVCSNKLDVQETNCCFSQFNRIWNHLFGHWTDIGRVCPLWNYGIWLIVSVLGNTILVSSDRSGKPESDDHKHHKISQQRSMLLQLHWFVFPQMFNSASCEALLYVFEDNEAVIKMIMKGRSPTMRHVSRTHRVALDWLFDRINLDPKIQIKYIETPKNQLADILTKGNFTRDEWNHLLSLFNISHFSFTVCSETMAKRLQQDSGEERVTAKSRPMMSLIARVPSKVSSSTSVSLVKRSFGKIREIPMSSIDRKIAFDYYYQERFMERRPDIWACANDRGDRDLTIYGERHN